MKYVLLALSWIIFYTLHTLLASSKLKRILEVKWGGGFKWYRLIYTTLSTLLFLGIIILALLVPKTSLFLKSGLTDYLGYMLAGFGTIIATKSSRNYSLKRFLGFSSAVNEEEQLVTTGLYAKVRHPLYSGLVLIFMGYFLFAGTISALIHLVCLLVYLPFGIYFEEKNLVEKFGEDYKNYREEVPALIPKFW
ncbi:Protein-S-isoprenylcysteine O-methyltransferase Ste14 [Algoriphagus locisalis]|uniref:Protein-S-isoprenylcysteine O-methyltransferase Ste14 n=1 Tax=Algoriphagus locisalis TaxID=305507 RepID=A0A1I7D9X7_9BACT|nr:isoprenylcysteine carboxylmethyltransferase family protein [Algoriphagus locisalis]SFU08437.1 Protein-S-isoprenylcysteine O-methyltransferase Ste14 [Algoriphagus locisalis]